MLVLVNTTTFIVIGIITVICDASGRQSQAQAQVQAQAHSPSAGPRHVVGRNHNGCQGKPVPWLFLACSLLGGWVLGAYLVYFFGVCENLTNHEIR